MRLFIRIDFDERPSFGPGKARLLERVDECGSITRAAVAMEMSYAHAWRLIEAAEITFGTPLVMRMTGGVNGGGARLTERGRDVVARYRELERRAAHGASEVLGTIRDMASPSSQDARGLVGVGGQIQTVEELS